MNTVAVAQQSTYPIASLYVGDLHPDVTEAMLYEKFSQSGPVLSIRVCRDLVTRRSLGYAYVNFQLPGDAERALDTMNFDELKGIPMRIMWSQRDPSVRKSGVGNIFIKNLDKTIDNKQLYDTFSQFGNILSCKIVKDDKGSKGYGFVHFESEESANSAIEHVNGMLLNDRKVFVGHFKSKPDRVKEIGTKALKFTNVFFKNLPENFSEDELKQLCADHGDALSIKLMVDAEGNSKMFGFASYADHEEAEKCVVALNGKEVNGKEIYAGRAQKKAERVQELKQQFMEKRQKEKGNKYSGVNLYVKNLDDTVTDEQLHEAFVVHGQITSAKVMQDPNGASKGFGFVCYSNPEEATKAVTEMNGRIVGSKPLYVALAQRKEERKAHLQQQYLQRAGGQGMSRVQGMPQLQGNTFGYPQMAPMPNYYMPQIPTSPRIMSPQQMSMGLPYQRLPNNQPRFAGIQGTGMARGQIPMNNRPGPGGPRGMPTQSYLPGGNNMLQRPPQMMQMQGIRQPYQGSVQQQSATATAQISPFKYTTQVRNVPGQAFNGSSGDHIIPQQPQQPQTPVETAAQVAPGVSVLTAEMLAKAEPSEQKQMLGERIYPLVAEQVGQDQAGKVTGMLLEIENNELLMMVENLEMLKERVKEACTVLQSHDSKK